MKKSDKKGLSDIVVTLIIIVLSLVAIGVVWVVISNVLKSGTQQANFQFGTLFLDLKIEKVIYDSSGNILVTVSRGTGQGDLSAIDFIFSDGTNSQVVKKTVSLQELGSQTFTFTSSDLGKVSFIKQLDIAPVINSGGTDQVGTKVNSKIYSTKEVIQNLGGVSWWRLNGDASDEFGNNPGTIVGGVSFVAGKSGQAASFDGSTGYITVTSPKQLPTGNIVSAIAWINPDSNQAVDKTADPNWNGIVSYGLRQCSGNSFLFSVKDSGALALATWCNDYPDSSSPVVNWGNPNFVASVVKGNSVNLYVNGQKSVAGTLGSTPNIQSGTLNIGCTDNPGRYYHGTVEDLVIFNKALTDNQIQALYNLDLSK